MSLPRNVNFPNVWDFRCRSYLFQQNRWVRLLFNEHTKNSFHTLSQSQLCTPMCCTSVDYWQCIWLHSRSISGLKISLFLPCDSFWNVCLLPPCICSQLWPQKETCNLCTNLSLAASMWECKRCYKWIREQNAFPPHPTAPPTPHPPIVCSPTKSKNKATNLFLIVGYSECRGGRRLYKTKKVFMLG